jgi:hypothetical protein
MRKRTLAIVLATASVLGIAGLSSAGQASAGSGRAWVIDTGYTGGTITRS